MADVKDKSQLPTVIDADDKIVLKDGNTPVIEIYPGALGAAKEPDLMQLDKSSENILRGFLHPVVSLAFDLTRLTTYTIKFSPEVS